MTARKLILLLLDPKLLYVKIARRVRYKYQSIKVRFDTLFGFDSGNIPLNYELEQSSHLIVKPGNPYFFKQSNFSDLANIESDFEKDDPTRSEPNSPGPLV